MGGIGAAGRDWLACSSVIPAQAVIFSTLALSTYWHRHPRAGGDLIPFNVNLKGTLFRPRGSAWRSPPARG